MTEEIEAVYEHGVLRPLHPLPFLELQKVRLTLTPPVMERVLANLAAAEVVVAHISMASHVARILPVVAHTIAVFGDERKASHWMSTPLALLGDRSPAQVLESVDGIELIEQVLTRIEHNIPS